MTGGDSDAAGDRWKVADAESSANYRMGRRQGLESGLARWMGAPVFRY